MKYFLLAEQVKSVFKEMDEASISYSQNNGISYPSKCNNCCSNPNVSATPLEMLPLALHLIKNNQVPKDFNSTTCLFKTSHCSVYEYRPTVCRLFGWTQVSGKNGQRLSICPKVQTPSGKLDLNAPNIANLALKVKELNPSLGSTIMPINQALKEMIDIILLSQSYT